MIILCSIIFFVLGFLSGSVIISMLSLSSKEAAISEALRMGYEMAKIERETIDVTELKEISNN